MLPVDVFAIFAKQPNSDQNLVLDCFSFFPYYFWEWSCSVSEFERVAGINYYNASCSALIIFITLHLCHYFSKRNLRQKLSIMKLDLISISFFFVGCSRLHLRILWWCMIMYDNRLYWRMIYIGNLSNDSNHGYGVGLASYFSQIGT